MIYTNLKASDTDESVLDINEIVNVELESDNVQSFNTRWGETIIAMEKNQVKSWEICRIVSFNSWSCESRCCRCTFKRHVVQKSESGDYIRLKKDGCLVSPTEIREKHFSSREGQLEKRVSGVGADMIQS